MQEQEEQEFWEWCGFTKIQYLDTSGGVCGIHWAHPLAPGGGSGSLPSRDLNSLFRYAVPKLSHPNILLYDDKFVGGWYCKLTIPESPWEVGAFGTDPALALYKAIQEVRKSC